jgi:hypothetical protein
MLTNILTMKSLPGRVPFLGATFLRPPEEMAYTLRPRGVAWDAGPPPGSASFLKEISANKPKHNRR